MLILVYGGGGDVGLATVKLICGLSWNWGCSMMMFRYIRRDFVGFRKTIIS